MSTVCQNRLKSNQSFGVEILLFLLLFCLACLRRTFTSCLNCSRTIPCAFESTFTSLNTQRLVLLLKIAKEDFNTVAHIRNAQIIVSVDKYILSVDKCFCQSTNIFCQSTNIFCQYPNIFCQFTNIFCKSTNIFCQSTNIFCQSTNICCPWIDIFFGAPIFFSSVPIFFGVQLVIASPRLPFHVEM